MRGQLLQIQGGDDLATRVDVFDEVFLVFLGLGTIVGIVVIAYLLQKAYKYREANGTDDEDVSRPTLGELPRGSDKGGRKLFLSFIISAVIVVSLIAWTYGLLLYVEGGYAQEYDDDAVDVHVSGRSFLWVFTYQDDDRLPANEVENLIDEHGEEAVLQALREDDLESLKSNVQRDLVVRGNLRVPVDHPVELEVTAPTSDVWHNFGITELRVKADAIPGETTETWFVAEEETPEDDPHLAECFELCGTGHGAMVADVHVDSQTEFEQWYDERTVDRNELVERLEEEVESE